MNHATSRTLLLVTTALLSLGATACSKKQDTSSEEAFTFESKQIRTINWSDAYDVQSLQDYGGNGGHHLGTFNPAKFSASVAHKDMRTYDEDRGCAGRTWSTSKQAAVDTFFVETDDDHLVEYDSWDYHRFVDIIADADNLGVFSSVWDSHGVDSNNSEGCLYYHFWVYRADGTFIRFEFDFTD